MGSHTFGLFECLPIFSLLLKADLDSVAKAPLLYGMQMTLYLVIKLSRKLL